MSTLVSETLFSFDRLADTGTNKEHGIGLKLPSFAQLDLSIESTVVTAEVAIERIKELRADFGWVMYRDKKEITPSEPSSVYFIEGEWCNGTKTISIRLIRSNQFAVTEFSHKPSETTSYICYTQQLKLGTDQSDEQCADYLIWFRLEDSGERAGRWMPVAQQFIGFSTSMEAQA